MNPQKANKHGVRAEDVQITSQPPKWILHPSLGHRNTVAVPVKWQVWVENERRPNGRQVLTEGNIYYCTQWRAQLERMQRNG